MNPTRGRELLLVSVVYVESQRNKIEMVWSVTVVSVILVSQDIQFCWYETSTIK